MMTDAFRAYREPACSQGTVGARYPDRAWRRQRLEERSFRGSRDPAKSAHPHSMQNPDGQKPPTLSADVACYSKAHHSHAQPNMPKKPATSETRDKKSEGQSLPDGRLAKLCDACFEHELGRTSSANFG